MGDADEIAVADAERPRRGGSNLQGIAPDDLGERSRQFLQHGGRRFGAGSRRQSRHQPIVSGASCHMSGNWSTSPWQVSQPTPVATCAAWLK
jgi:hypothetical protein